MLLVDWDLYWGIMLTLFLWIPLAIIWMFAIVDLFGRADLGGLSKVLWLLAIVFLPILGTLIYYVSRPVLPSDRYRDVAGDGQRAELYSLQERGLVMPEKHEA